MRIVRIGCSVMSFSFIKYDSNHVLGSEQLELCGTNQSGRTMDHQLSGLFVVVDICP